LRRIPNAIQFRRRVFLQKRVAQVSTPAAATPATNSSLLLRELSSPNSRHLSAAVSLEVEYRVEVASVSAGNAMAADMTSGRAAFEAQMTTGMQAAIAANPTLAASFQVTGVTSRDVVVETEIVYLDSATAGAMGRTSNLGLFGRSWSGMNVVVAMLAVLLAPTLF